MECKDCVESVDGDPGSSCCGQCQEEKSAQLAAERQRISAEPSPGYYKMYLDEKARAEAAAARVKELEAELAHGILDATAVMVNAKAKAEANYKELREWAWEHIEKSGNVEWDRMIERHDGPKGGQV